MIEIKLLPEKILIYRHMKNLTQEKLGILLGYDKNVAKQIINNWEKGRREPNLSHVIKLCDAFEITVGDFLR